MLQQLWLWSQLLWKSRSRTKRARERLRTKLAQPLGQLKQMLTKLEQPSRLSRKLRQARLALQEHSEVQKRGALPEYSGVWVMVHGTMGVSCLPHREGGSI